MPVDPSAAPQRERGLRSRAGNAMARTRSAVLDGAARAVEKHGARRATMADIATLAGIAKGTLYNHFRTKDAVYAAAVDAGVQSVVSECVTVARDDLADALSLAVDRLSSHPALRRIAADEPAVLAALTSIGREGSWTTARTGIAAVLHAADRAPTDAAVDVVLRWLVTFVGTSGAGAEAQAAVVVGGLPVAAPDGAAPA